jgi:DNA (cytosine-5)-methyltransferase 1
MKIGTDFSGIGSPEMALKMLGIEHEQVFACEIDKYARKSFEAVHGSPKEFYNDITTRDHSTVPQLDLYCAGFPCQSFSMAGKRKGFDDVRGTLFFNVAEFIKTNQPKVFVLENVKGLLSHDGGKTFQTIISLLTDNGGTANGQMFIPYFEDGLGYHIYYKVLNTKHYGIPQNRERIFIVGFKEFREFRFPKPFALELRLKDMLQDNPEYKHFLSDKGSKYVSNPMRLKKKFTQINGDIALTVMAQCMQSCVGDFIDVDDKYYLSDKMLDYFKVHNDRHDKKGTGFMWQPKEGDDVANALRANASLNATDNTIKVIDKSIKQDVCTCIDGSYHKGFGIRNGVCRQVVKVPSATKKGFEEAEDGDSISLEHPSSKTRRGRVGKGVAQTVNTGNGQAVVKEFRIRRLTPLECWRLQGFPDDAFFRAKAVNSDTQLYRQAGNSITVNVMMEIFKKIY